MKPFHVLSLSVLFCLVAALCSAQSMQTPSKRSPVVAQSSYWMLVGQFVDKTAHLTYAQRMKELHGATFTEKQQQEYSVVTAQYSDYLDRLRKNELVNHEQFWTDAKSYAEHMIIGPGVPIPGRPSALYSLHTGSPDEDRLLCERVAGQIDVARVMIASRDLLARSGR